MCVTHGVIYPWWDSPTDVNGSGLAFGKMCKPPATLICNDALSATIFRSAIKMRANVPRNVNFQKGSRAHQRNTVVFVHKFTMSKVYADKVFTKMVGKIVKDLKRIDRHT